MGRYAQLHNLNLQEAIDFLEVEAHKNEADTDSGAETPELKGLSLDAAYDLGYRTALHTLQSITSPPATELGIMIRKDV